MMQKDDANPRAPGVLGISNSVAKGAQARSAGPAWAERVWPCSGLGSAAPASSPGPGKSGAGRGGGSAPGRGAAGSLGVPAGGRALGRPRRDGGAGRAAGRAARAGHRAGPAARLAAAAARGGRELEPRRRASGTRAPGRGRRNARAAGPLRRRAGGRARGAGGARAAGQAHGGAGGGGGCGGGGGGAGRRGEAGRGAGAARRGGAPPGRPRGGRRGRGLRLQVQPREAARKPVQEDDDQRGTGGGAESSEGTAGGHLQAHEGQRGDLRGDVGRRRAGAAQALRHVGRLPRRPALRSRRPWQASLAPTHRDAEVLPDRAAPFLQLLHLPPGCPPPRPCPGRALPRRPRAGSGSKAQPRSTRCGKDSGCCGVQSKNTTPCSLKDLWTFVTVQKPAVGEPSFSHKPDSRTLRPRTKQWYLRVALL